MINGSKYATVTLEGIGGLKFTGGLFTNLTYIDEALLAQLTSLNVPQVYLTLKSL